MKKGNIFSAIPDVISEEIFETIIFDKAVHIERIISKGHASPESGWYDQDKNEWVMVLKGEAVLAFEDQPSIHLKSGEYIDIPSHSKHKVEWTDPNTETVWLAIHY